MTPPENITSAGLICYGPLAVRHTDIPHDGDKMTLWTPQVGDVLLRLFPDWQTVVQWDHGQLFVGQNVNYTVGNIIADASTGGIARNTGGHSLDSIICGWGSGAEDGATISLSVTASVFHTTDPVQIQLGYTSGTDPTTGYVEIYAVVLRRSVPTP